MWTLYESGKLESLGFKALALTKIQNALECKASAAAPAIGLLHEDKFRTSVKEFKFGDGASFQAGFLGIVTTAMIVRSIEEECLSNSDGKWADEYRYVVLEEAVETVLPASSTIGSVPIVRDRGHAGMRLSDFFTQATQVSPGITEAEVATLRMYTGEFYRPWNEALRYGKNVQQWATCLSVLYSAAIKLSRDAPNYKQLYRGLDETQLELPGSFLKEDDKGFAGGVELAYMSTTTDINVAYNVSGGRAKKGSILMLELSAATRGADVQFLSLYPHETEILFPPCTYLTCTGQTWRESKRYVTVRADVSTARPDVSAITTCPTVPPKHPTAPTAPPPPPDYAAPPPPDYTAAHGRD
jgi:hypothetical protein